MMSSRSCCVGISIIRAKIEQESFSLRYAKSHVETLRLLLRIIILAYRMFCQQLKVILLFALEEACCTNRVKAITLNIDFVRSQLSGCF